MKLIIEHGSDGRVFFYEESNSLHREAEKSRRDEGLTRRSLEDLAKECSVSPGEYLVMPLVEVD